MEIMHDIELVQPPNGKMISRGRDSEEGEAVENSQTAVTNSVRKPVAQVNLEGILPPYIPEMSEDGTDEATVDDEGHKLWVLRYGHISTSPAGPSPLPVPR